MLILSLESAGSGCSACVWRDGHTIAQAHEPMERGQDQRLMPLILGVMKDAGIEFDACDHIAVTCGPGSFTGLRIGLAAARGIGLAANKPVIGIDRFAIYRRQFETPGQNLLVTLDSRRKELFCRFYSSSPMEPCMMTPDEIAAFLKHNSDTVMAGDVQIEGVKLSKESEAVTCAALAAIADLNDPAFLPRPLYIRAPDVTIK